MVLVQIGGASAPTSEITRWATLTSHHWQAPTHAIVVLFQESPQWVPSQASLPNPHTPETLVMLQPIILQACLQKFTDELLGTHMASQLVVSLPPSLSLTQCKPTSSPWLFQEGLSSLPVVEGWWLPFGPCPTCCVYWKST
jgi:hypothetical protein